MAASVMACRVAALFSSRREGGGEPGSPAVWGAEADDDGGTHLHYVHVCTLRNYFRRQREPCRQGPLLPASSPRGSQESESWQTAISAEQANHAAALKSRLDQAVKDGTLTQAEADAVTKAAEKGVIGGR